MTFITAVWKVSGESLRKVGSSGWLGCGKGNGGATVGQRKQEEEGEK